MKNITLRLTDESYSVLTRFLSHDQNMRLSHKPDGQVIKERVIQNEEELLAKIIVDRVSDLARVVPDPSVEEKRKQIEKLQQEITEATKTRDIQIVVESPTPVVEVPVVEHAVKPATPIVPGR